MALLAGWDLGAGGQAAGGHRGVGSACSRGEGDRALGKAARPRVHANHAWCPLVHCS